MTLSDINLSKLEGYSSIYGLYIYAHLLLSNELFSNTQTAFSERVPCKYLLGTLAIYCMVSQGNTLFQ